MSYKKLILISLLSFAVIPMLILALLFGKVAIDTAVQLKKESVRESARSMSASLREIVEFQKLSIRLLSTDVYMRNFVTQLEDKTTSISELDSQSLNQSLYEYTKATHKFNYILVLDIKGNVVASSINSLLGKSLATESYFQNTLDSNDVVFGNATASLLDPQKYTLPVGYTICGKNNQPVCMIVAFEQPEFLAMLINGMKLGETGQIFIMDSNSFVFSNSDARYNNMYTVLPSLKRIIPDYLAGLAPRIGDCEFQLQGVDRFYSYSIAENARWTVVVRQDYSEIYAVRNKLVQAGASIGFIFILLAFIASVFISKFITNPILKLKEVFVRGAKDMVFTTCDIQYKNEIGDLANNFNTMVSFMNYYDKLTGLLSRKAFITEVNKLLQGDLTVGIFFIDLDDFKTVNDLHGHQIGDEFLSGVGRIMKETSIDADLCSRFGGDEFLIAVKGDHDKLNAVATHLNKLLQIPLEIAGLTLPITASMGIAVYPKDGTDITTLIKHADIAMYEAKAKGKNAFVYFGNEMNAQFKRVTLIKDILSMCIENNQLLLEYQPEINISTEKVVAFEALLRLHSDEHGLISPGEFIKIAEGSNQILKIGAWVIENAFLFAKRIYDQNINFGLVAVNISAQQLAQVNFVETIMETVTRIGIPPTCLQFEISESTIMKDMTQNVKKLSLLREHGFTIAMDDFGTFYSSLNYLTKLPIDILKIDKSFVDDVCTDNKKQAVVKAIIQMSSELHIKVVAEGVEELSQLQYLSNCGCKIIQGYYYSRPLQADQAIEFVLEKNVSS